MINAIVKKRMAQALLILGPITTLAVSPSPSYDPINLIKVLCVSTIAFFLLALVIYQFNGFKSKLPKSIWISGALFLASLISAFSFSGANKQQQFWGEFGRSTGFLTYLSLVIIFYAIALIQDANFYKNIVKSLIATVIPVTIYCLIQMAGMDPIGWSAKDTFATLGNINFLSAFLGMTSVSLTFLVLGSSFSITSKLGLGFLTVLDLYIVYSTGSIQGVMIYFAGLVVGLFIYIQKTWKSKVLGALYSISSLGILILSIFALMNKGPLAKIIYQPTIIFRTDYWHAGWAMTIHKPIFGVGLDTYGDWYRVERGSISTLRTGPNRIANTAHNIFLDISSNGGLPLLLSYIAILTFSLIAAVRLYKRNSNFDPVFVSLFSTWFAYQLQSLVSINQIGVGVWGWILSGSLVGYEICTRDSSGNLNINSGKNKKNRQLVMPAGAGLAGFIGLAVGFTLAFIPFNADSKFKTALNSRDMLKMISATNLLGATSYHAELALDIAIKSNLAPQARDLAFQLVARHPRNFMGWGAIQTLTSSTPEEKMKAIKILNELDPFNPDLPKL